MYKNNADKINQGSGSSENNEFKIPGLRQG